MISKELLSEVLNVENERISKKVDRFCFPTENIIAVSYYMEDGWQHLNIYELAHKCKEWAISKGYDILSGGLEASLYSCYIDYSDKRYTLQMTPLHHEFANTEPEAIFEACQWILDNREIK